MSLHKSLAICVPAFLGLCLISCQPRVPKDALALSPESLQDRQMQTRTFETTDEKMLLTASAQLLQDLGYTIDESEVPCGVIVASRDRDVTNTGQVVGSILLAVLTGAATPVDRNQKVLASCVTKPLDDKRIAVRITFQHMVWNTSNKNDRNRGDNPTNRYKCVCHVWSS